MCIRTLIWVEPAESLEGALPLPLLEALAGSTVVTRLAPELAERLGRSLSQRRSAAPRISPAHDMASSAFGIHAFTSDGQARRSKVLPQACLQFR